MTDPDLFAIKPDALPLATTAPPAGNYGVMFAAGAAGKAAVILLITANGAENSNEYAVLFRDSRGRDNLLILVGDWEFHDLLESIRAWPVPAPDSGDVWHYTDSADESGRFSWFPFDAWVGPAAPKDFPNAAMALTAMADPAWKGFGLFSDQLAVLYRYRGAACKMVQVSECGTGMIQLIDDDSDLLLALKQAAGAPRRWAFGVAGGSGWLTAFGPGPAPRLTPVDTAVIPRAWLADLRTLCADAYLQANAPSGAAPSS